MKRSFLHTCIIILCCFSPAIAFAQYEVRGTVTDSSRRYMIEAVSVMATNGRGTMTDSLGRYRIDVGEKDSIWFSFLGKSTPKYPVLKMQDVMRFDIALRMRVDVLPEVRIRSRNYKEDSVQNRKDYAKVFDYRRVNFESLTSTGPMGAGIDINELIRMFQFKKNRSMLRFQERLIEQEKEKFVSHRFNKALVRRLTSLDGAQLDQFMLMYRPGYEFTLSASEYNFQLYIKNAADIFLGKKSF